MLPRRLTPPVPLSWWPVCHRRSCYSSATAVPRVFFFFNDTATTEIYTLSLPDALPICRCTSSPATCARGLSCCCALTSRRSEEHTSELQSRLHLVCRLLLEKKNTT